MEAVITIPFDPYFRVGPIPVHWYGVGYAVAFLVGLRLCVPFMGRRGIPEKTATDLIWWDIVFGLIGARLFWAVQQPHLEDFLRAPLRLIAVWEGGMAFFGAVVVCLVVTFLLCRRWGLPAWVVLDAGGLFATLPQAIGRLGNIVNGDILGPPSNLPWAVRYTSPLTFAPVRGQAYQPANAYELLAALALFAMVVWLIRRGARPGTAGIAYVAGYAVSQVLVFFLRATEPPVLLGLKQAQVTALVVLLVVVPALVWARRRYPDAFVADRPVAVEAEPQTG
ncbi:MAG TPA: prolipoprotein diacylglyceryl transferase [Candidatus Dormibacteraeota bacterium]|jgi:phosphatidylglycerol:prolipoprotein diacylglycerol transferase|nr:prolipoprotein diacylglyceryl transferase [Candidatus Dormibacteraeota bacterium]